MGGPTLSKVSIVLITLFSSSLAILACSSNEGAATREANEPVGSLDLALVDGGVDGGQLDGGADAAP